MTDLHAIMDHECMMFSMCGQGLTTLADAGIKTAVQSSQFDVE
jgi:hypothetical protein